MVITRKGNESDIKGVLALQALNLSSNLSEKEKEAGFVTTPFTRALILEIIKQDGLFVAEENEEIISYVYAGSWDYFQQWDIFKYMVARLPNLSFEGNPITVDSSFQYGPVCIAKEYRGQGLLNLIFEEMRTEFVKKYPTSITFINKVNSVSEKAHKKLGWIIVDEFNFNNNTYLGLAFDMQKSVLK